MQVFSEAFSIKVLLGVVSVEVLLCVVFVVVAFLVVCNVVFFALDFEILDLAEVEALVEVSVMVDLVELVVAAWVEDEADAAAKSTFAWAAVADVAVLEEPGDEETARLLEEPDEVAWGLPDVLDKVEAEF